MPHTCHTYINVSFNIDIELNAEFIRRGVEPTPEQLGINNRDEVESALKRLTDRITWRRHSFIIGFNDEYDVDVNNMIRKTLGELLSKTSELKEIQEHFGVSISLVIVSTISTRSDEAAPYLSLENDIIEFLFNSKISHDLDYYFSE